MTMHKKSFTVDVDSQVSEGFSNQVDKCGYTKYRAVETALRIWTSLPPEIQVSLMVESPEGLYQLLVERLLDVEVLKILSKMKPQERLHILHSVRSTKPKVSRKKKVL